MDTEVTAGRLDEFPDGDLVPVNIDGHALIVARMGDEVHVAVNRCPHMGLSLTRGPGGLRFSDGVVQCPWHNSCFDVRTGQVTNGPAKVDLKTFKVELRDDKVCVGVRRSVEKSL